jgi:hypothetical protein
LEKKSRVLSIKNFIFLDISSDSGDFEEEQKNAAKKFNTLVFLVGTRFIASGAGTIFPTGTFFSRCKAGFSRRKTSLMVNEEKYSPPSTFGVRHSIFFIHLFSPRP